MSTDLNQVMWMFHDFGTSDVYPLSEIMDELYDELAPWFSENKDPKKEFEDTLKAGYIELVDSGDDPTYKITLVGLNYISITTFPKE